jgi:hypothetical protein
MPYSDPLAYRLGLPQDPRAQPPQLGVGGFSASGTPKATTSWGNYTDNTDTAFGPASLGRGLAASASVGGMDGGAMALASQIPGFSAALRGDYADTQRAWGNPKLGVNSKGEHIGFQAPSVNLGDTARSWAGKRSGAQGRAASAADAIRASAQQQWKANVQSQVTQFFGGLAPDVRAALMSRLTPEQVQNAIISSNGGDGGVNEQMQGVMLDRTQQGLERQVDAYFLDPRRAVQREQMLAAQRQQGQQGITDQTKLATRANAFRRAGQGTLGGSQDLAARDQIGRQRNASAMQLESGLQDQRQNWSNADAAEKAGYYRLIHAPDQAGADAAQSQIRQIQAEQWRLNEEAQTRGQIRKNNTATSQAYGNAIGGALSQGANAVRAFQGGGF